MSKNKDRKLFGRGKLSSWMRDEDEPRPDSADEFEERRPAWEADIAYSRKSQQEDRKDEQDADQPARDRRAKDEGEKTSSRYDAEDQDDAEADAGAPADGDEKEEPNWSRVYQTQQNRSEADQAWEREAQRVESSQYRRAGGSRAADLDEEEASGGKTKKKGKRYLTD